MKYIGGFMAGIIFYGTVFAVLLYRAIVSVRNWRVL